MLLLCFLLELFPVNNLQSSLSFASVRALSFFSLATFKIFFLLLVLATSLWYMPWCTFLYILVPEIIVFWISGLYFSSNCKFFHPLFPPIFLSMPLSLLRTTSIIKNISAACNFPTTHWCSVFLFFCLFPSVFSLVVIFYCCVFKLTIFFPSIVSKLLIVTSYVFFNCRQLFFISVFYLDLPKYLLWISLTYSCSFYFLKHMEYAQYVLIFLCANSFIWFISTSFCIDWSFLLIMGAFSCFFACINKFLLDA